VRQVGRQTKKEFKVGWSAMPGADKLTLESFHDTYNSTEFDWTHPITDAVYAVYFVDDELNFTSRDGAVNYWEVEFTLGEV